jgi:tRNA(Ile)-lysidine synthase
MKASVDFEKSMSLARLEPGTPVVIGISGGVDSVVLLHLALKFQLKVVSAHVNYMLRDGDSMEDEAFVRNLCIMHKLECEVLQASSLFDDNSGDSLQMQARTIRRNWFESLLEKHKAAAILLGHHADDQAETFFIRIFRGQGILGLSAMKQYNMPYLRPLLKVRRADIIEYALKNEITWREDSSNASDKYLRNKIRHHLLPAVEQVDEHGIQSLLNSVERLKSERSIYLSFLRELESTIKTTDSTGFRLLKEPLSNFEDASPIIQYLLRETQFSYALCSQIAANLTNSESLSYSNGTWEVISDRTYLSVYQRDNKVSPTLKHIRSSIRIEEIPEGNDITLLFSQLNAIIDANKAIAPLTLRKWQSGDRFWPSGMNGSKLLSDYFTDQKFGLEEKENQLILCSGDDIVWLVNQRVDRRFAAISATKNAWRLTINWM